MSALMWSEFASGFAAGAFTIVALGVSFIGWAVCAVGGRYDDAMTEPYDPEVR